VKRWAWETFWLTGGFFSWIIAPWFFGLLMTKDLLAVLHETPGTVLFWTFFFGLLWGVGGLTFGLTMRYLGLSLGMAVVLGLCAAFGTLIPPIFRGEFMTQVLGTSSGRIILVGIFVCLLGIAAAGVAGIYKERAMSPEQQRITIKEFDLKKGVGVAMLSGVMSACFAYGLAAGDPIKTLTIKHGTPDLWQGLPVLVVVLIGGFTTNFIWCLILNIRNKTGYQYFTATSREPNGNGLHDDETIIETALDAPSREVVEHIARVRTDLRAKSSTAVADAPASRISTLKKAATPAYRCSETICYARWRARPGIFNFSFTPWARPKWAATNSPVGHCTWPASSSSAASGHRLEGMEGRWSSGRSHARSCSGFAGGVDRDRRLRKLSGTGTLRQRVRSTAHPSQPL